MATKADYDILEIPVNSPIEDVKKAYRKQAMKYHPDKNQGDKFSEEKFKKITNAYESICRDIESGRNRGNSRESEFNFNDFDFGFDFNDFYKDFFGHRRGEKKKEDLTIKAQASVSIKEIFDNKEKSITYRRKCVCKKCSGSGKNVNGAKRTCGKCSGTGKIKTNNRVHTWRILDVDCYDCKGLGAFYDEKCDSCSEGLITKEEIIDFTLTSEINSGTVITFRNKGNESQKDCGDLAITFQIYDDGLEYTKENLNLSSKLRVNIFDLILGSEIVISHISGNNLKVKLKKELLNSEKIRLPQKGFVYNTGKAIIHGDYYLNLYITIPDNLPDDLKNKIKEYLDGE